MAATQPKQVPVSPPKKRSGGAGGARPGAGRPRKNPGTPKSQNITGIEGRVAARAHAERAMRVLVTIMNNANSKDSDRISAATEILNRAYGRPVQAVQLPEGDEGQVFALQAINIVPVPRGQFVPAPAIEHDDRPTIIIEPK